MVSSRQLLATAVAAGLLWSGGTSATTFAEDSSGPTVVIEAPDDSAVRAAISFPAGWRLEAPAAGARRQIHAVTVDERCEVGTRRSSFSDLATDVDDFEVTLAPGSGYIRIAREQVQLPAGPAERVDFAAADEGGRWSMYAVWDDGFVHELWCRGDELPDDRWSSIAEGFDLDPDPSLTSSPFEPLVARPDAGVAMAFGEEWQVRGSSTNQGLLYATSETAVCALSDYSAIAADRDWDAVDAMHDEYVEIASSRDDLSVEQSAYLDMRPGRTGFADITFSDGTRAVRWSFADPSGETLLALFCVGDPMPEDRFMALAQTVAWSPGDTPSRADRSGTNDEAGQRRSY